MRKISIAFLFWFVMLFNGYSQTNQFDVNNTSGLSQQTFEDPTTGYVGIGCGAPSSSSPGISALQVANISYTGLSTGATPPFAVMSVFNKVNSHLPSGGNSPVTFATIRTENNGDDPEVDFIIDNNGLVGIGGFPGIGSSILGTYGNGVINAHLYLTDQNGDGFPLFASYTHSSNIGMMIDGNGLVGIGNYPTIGSPGTGGIGSFPIPGNGNTNAHLYITDAAGDGYPLIAAYGASIAPPLFVAGTSNNNYVGIGTATPTAPLDVAGNTILENNLAVTGNSTLTGTLDVGGIATFGHYIRVSDGAYAGGQIVAGSASATTTGGLLAVVGTGGAGLDLINNGYAGWANQIKFMNAPGTLRHLIYDDNSGSVSSTNGNLVIVPGISGGGGNNVVSIMGRVQIGNVPITSTSAPTLATDYSLYVEKGIISEKYKCALSSDATNWSDYVFDQDYKLAPLSEVETYIQKNKHLPGVPSTDDVHCDGIDLAQIDATLLKKIEELTLYMLKQQKEIETLKSQLSTTK